MCIFTYCHTLRYNLKTGFECEIVDNGVVPVTASENDSSFRGAGPRRVADGRGNR